MTAATATKNYDGNTSSTVTPTITTGSLAAGDTAAFSETFDTPDVGTGKTLTAAGSVNDGNGGANYVVNFAIDTTGVILAAIQTTTTVTTSLASVSYGTSVTFTATVTPFSGAAAPTQGSVEFFERHDQHRPGTRWLWEQYQRRHSQLHVDVRNPGQDVQRYHGGRHPGHLCRWYRLRQ